MDDDFILNVYFTFIFRRKEVKLIFALLTFYNVYLLSIVGGSSNSLINIHFLSLIIYSFVLLYFQKYFFTAKSEKI